MVPSMHDRHVRADDKIFHLGGSVAHASLKDYEDAWQAETSLREYFEFYCHGRRHQALEKRTPAEVYGACRKKSRTQSKKNHPR